MIRGFLIGLISAVSVCMWARRQTAHVVDHRHRVNPDTHISRRAREESAKIFATIERESPWILKPNAKPSSNSSAQS